MFHTSIRLRVLTALIVVLALGGIIGAPAPAFASGVVGNGTPGSCTEAALDNALNGGGKVKFKCGPSPVTIQLTATKTIATNTTIDGGNKITLTGAAHYPFKVNSSVTFNLRRITIKASHGDDAGALRNDGTAKLTNVKFEGNRADNFGGAISNFGTLTLTDVRFTNNKAPDGGALYNDGGNVMMTYASFQGNQADRNDGSGGAIFNHAGALQVAASSFSQNSALDGGAINNHGGADLLTIYSDFTNNQAGYGAAVENWGNIYLLISNFKSNQATSDGGAVWSVDGKLELTYAALDQNTAGTTGGGVSIYGGEASIQEVSMTHNHANSEGGGIYSTANLTLENVTLSANTSNSTGGGLYYAGGTLNSHFATVADNTGTSGGGIYATGAFTADIQNTVLNNNTNGNCGGTVPSNDFNFSSDNTCTGLNKPHDTQNANPFLAPLANNGGMGQTHLPQPASPLRDGGTNVDGIGIDERVIFRPQDSVSDMGALETCFVAPDKPELTDPQNGTAVPATHLQLHWNFSPCGAFYKVVVRRDSKKGAPVFQSNYETTGIVFMPILPKNVTYYWRVTACNENACANSPWWHFTVTKGPHAPPRVPPFFQVPAQLLKQMPKLH